MPDALAMLDHWKCHLERLCLQLYWLLLQAFLGYPKTINSIPNVSKEEI